MLTARGSRRPASTASRFASIWQTNRNSSPLSSRSPAGRALPEKHLPYPGKRPTAFIVICQNTNWEPDVGRFQKDIGIVAQTMLLAATQAGLGGIMIGNFSPPKLAAALSLPEHLTPVLIVAFGKPDEEVILTEAAPGEPLNYYRDAADVHYVPKRRLQDVLIN